MCFDWSTSRTRTSDDGIQYLEKAGKTCNGSMKQKTVNPNGKCPRASTTPADFIASNSGSFCLYPCKQCKKKHKKEPSPNDYSSMIKF